MSLGGRSVLIPRGGSRGAAWAHEVDKRGGRAVLAPLVEIVPPADDAPLRAALARLAEGEYAWLALTSVNAVHALTAHGAHLGGARVSVVGEATAAAVREAGWQVDLLPELRTGAGLVEAWAAMIGQGGESSGSGARVLLPLSALAADTLETGLIRLGYEADRVTAYDLAALDPPADLVAAVDAGAIDAIILTSGSVARRVREVFPELPESVIVVCIGEPSAQVARAVGLTVHAVATTSTGAGTIEALERWLSSNRPSNSRPSSSKNQENDA